MITHNVPARVFIYEDGTWDEDSEMFKSLMIGIQARYDQNIPTLLVTGRRNDVIMKHLEIAPESDIVHVVSKNQFRLQGRQICKKYNVEIEHYEEWMEENGDL